MAPTFQTMDAEVKAREEETSKAMAKVLSYKGKGINRNAASPASSPRHSYDTNYSSLDGYSNALSGSATLDADAFLEGLAASVVENARIQEERNRLA